MSQLLRITILSVSAAFVLGSSPIHAAQVRGSVAAPPKSAPRDVNGYTRTQVAAPAKGVDERKMDVALFLRSKESLPIPAPITHLSIVIDGMRLIPDVAACAVDGEVMFNNQGREPVTLTVGGTKLGPIEPGGSAAYSCTVGESEEARQIRIPRWRHIVGLVYVGMSGVAARPNERGYFVMNAPQGTYELQYITSNGVAKRSEVEIERSDVDVGAADLAVTADGTSDNDEPPENE